jgi:hypothetical protein
MLQLVVTDLAGRNRAFPIAWNQVSITRTLNGYCEGSISLDRFDASVPELQVASRCMKFYQDGNLRLHGQIWDGLQIGSQGVVIPVRDPFANYSWRRVRAIATYTAQDAGAIASARITAQNALAPTGLRYAAASQTSVNRTYTVLPGTLETDIFDNLTGMSQGFFFLINPVDNVAGTFAECLVQYPNAGVTREAVRFGYGKNTTDNLSDYQVQYAMPLNRAIASSSQSTGGRIVGLAEDTASEGTYLLYEDETVQAQDISDTTLLTALANPMIRSNPPETYTITPNKNSPLLFTDFDVGDFVRLHISDVAPDGTVAMSKFIWVRVTKATIVFDPDGTQYMSSMTVESLVGGKPYVRPEDAFREYLDDNRAAVEALARKVQNITASTTTGASTGTGSTTGDPTTVPPSDPTPPPPPPPPAPDQPPTINSFGANGIWYGGTSPGVSCSADVNSNGNHTNVWFVVDTGASSGTSGVDGDQSVNAEVHGLSRGSSHTVTCHASNSAGEVTASASFTVPTVQSV